MLLTGNFAALVTPFRSGSVDLPALKAHVERLLGAGVHGLVPCGTTGESPTLTHKEHDQVVEWTVEAASGRAPVIAGTGSNSTAEAVRLTRAAAQAGADAVLSVTPYYNRPSQSGIVRHFAAVAEASPLPVVLYDIPGRCGAGIDLDSLQQLAEHPNIVGIKEATGTVDRVTRIRNQAGLQVLCGDDALTLPMLALGAQGVISVASNLYPDESVELIQRAMDEDFAGALQVHERLEPVFRALFVESNPVPLKAALARKGWMTEEIRPPLDALSPSSRCHLEQVLDRYEASRPPFLPRPTPAGD